MDAQVMKSTGSVTTWLILLALLAGSGCGKPESTPQPVPRAPGSTGAASGASPASGSSQQVGASVESGSKNRGSFQIGIVPTNPDVQTGVRLSFQEIPSGVAMKPGTIRWFVNGGEIKGQADQLPGTQFHKGNLVRATAEGEMNGEPILLSTPELSVRNALPEAVTVSLNPMAPKTGETVRASAQGRDADGDPVSFRYRWFVGGAEVPGQAGDTFALKGIARGAWIHAEAQSFDGEALGSRMFSPQIQIANSPPYVVRVDYTPSSGSTFEARIVTGDPDGDVVSIRGKSLPEGVTLRGNVLSGTRSAVQERGSLPASVIISDGNGAEFEYDFNFSIAPN